MIFFVLIFFVLTLYFAQNKHRAKSLISNVRRNWSYILGVIGGSQFIMGFTYEPKHFFIGAFVGAWAWFVYVARKGQKVTWKTAIKTTFLVLSSIIYLAAVNNPNSWVPVVLDAIFLVIVVALGFDFTRVTNPTTVVTTIDTSPISREIVDEARSPAGLKPHHKISKRTKRLIYWISGSILFIIILPFIILAIDKAVNGYLHYYHSVQNIGKEEKYDSVVVTEEDIPISDIIYYRSDGNVEVYPIENYYNSLDSCAE